MKHIMIKIYYIKILNNVTTNWCILDGVPGSPKSLATIFLSKYVVKPSLSQNSSHVLLGY